MSDPLDPRLHAFRPDLADRRLAGQVEAERYVSGEPRRVTAANVPLKPEPDAAATTVTELLYGEVFTVFEDRSGWAWGQLETDGYVGYAASASLGEQGPQATHRISSLCTFLYPEPDLKRPPLASLSLGSLVRLGYQVETRGTTYRTVEGGGAIVAAHAMPVDAVADNDFVVVAERFLNVPYLWGGRTSGGVDCSSLVQLSLMCAGRSAPRDTDLQEQRLGRHVEGGIEAALHPGDLVFWRGHVAIMIDGEYMIHASGHHMMVVIEPVADAVTRFAGRSGRPTSVKRL